MTGAGTAAERGFPDVGLITMTEMVANAKYIADAVNIPVICDADTGYGNPLNVHRTVREYEAAGVAAIHLEDQVFPKKCGFFAGKQVVPVEEHVQKIRAALDARTDPDFVIIARCDAYAVTGWEDTVRRCRAYVGAGADLVFVDGIKSQDDIQRYAADLADVPRMYNGDLATTQTMNDLGYKIMICGSTIWLIYKQVRAAYEELMADGMVNPDRYGTRWDVASVLGWTPSTSWKRSTACRTWAPTWPPWPPPRPLKWPPTLPCSPRRTTDARQPRRRPRVAGKWSRGDERPFPYAVRWRLPHVQPRGAEPVSPPA